MQSSARDAYLETQVLTANPFKLRLMLIEGAMRFTGQSLMLWDEGRDEAAWEASIRAREIISEIMSSLTRELTPLAKQILPLYTYIFRTITEGQLERNRDKVLDALRILGEERETWRMVCEQFAGEIENLQAQAPTEIVAPKTLPAAEVAATTTASTPAAPFPAFDSSRLMAPPVSSPGFAPAAPLAAPRSFSFEA